MDIISGIFHLLWNIITIPFHLLAAVIKIVILGPLVVIVTLACLVFGCLALLSPATLSAIHIQPPEFITTITSQLSHVTVPSVPTREPELVLGEVTSGVRDNAIVVSWSGGEDGAQWYEVLRKTTHETTWRRIAIVPATKSTDGHFEYTDPETQHGVTYRYAITEVTASGSESPPVESAFQVVAP